MPNSNKDYMMKGQFTAENSVLFLIDDQVGTIKLIRSSSFRRLSAQHCHAGHHRQDVEHPGRTYFQPGRQDPRAYLARIAEGCSRRIQGSREARGDRKRVGRSQFQWSNRSDGPQEHHHGRRDD